MKSMPKKNQNKIGNCKWCSKNIYSNEAYMTVQEEYSCIKCFKNSGHMLPFWGKNNERHKIARAAREENRIQRKRNEVV